MRKLVININILIIDDEKLIVKGLKHSLEQQGYNVYAAYDGVEAMRTITYEKIDFIILDLMLPDIDGMMLCKKIRENYNMPILMLSAKDGDYDKILGFEFGADDYMTKPFHFDELLSRINALTRRNQYQHITPNNAIKTFGNLQIDSNQYKVYLNKAEIELSPQEFKLLKYLSDHTEKAVTRLQILNAVWGISFDNQSNVVDVYISYLRNKIEVETKFIHTIKGIGYMFKVS